MIKVGGICSSNLFFYLNEYMRQKLLLIASVLCFFMACQTTESTVSHDSFAMSSYSSFLFGELPPTSSEDLRFLSMEFEARVKQELRFILAGKGLEEIPQAELLVYFFTLPESDEDFQAASLPYSISLNSEIAEVPESHNFIIDFVDRSSRLLIWRSSGKIEVTNEELRNKQLPTVITKLLRDLPV